MAKFGVALLVAVAALGCASGPMTLVGYKVPRRQQVAIVIDVSDQVNQADQGGAIATLADTITDRLKEHGIDSQLYTSKYDHPKPPRVDVFISYWHGSPKAAHDGQAISGGAALGNALVGPAALVAAPVAIGMAYNNVIVDCKVTLPGKDMPVFTRHFEKSGFGGWGSENDANGAAESAGNAIVAAILQR
ncbi:MAG TPA: hypothetical protein VER96_28180 [Polyangiaceae bacterium]|nr:hypothetical protein [Polyangiaceae bacterium]